MEICHAVQLSVIVVFKLYHFHLGANAVFQSSLDFGSHLEVVCICYFQMIWTWTQPVRPSCVQFSLLVNQASFTEAPAARSKESAVCRENQLFIIYHLKDQHLLLIDQYCQDSPPISESPQSSTRSPSPKCCQLQSQPVIEIGNSRKMRIFSPCLKSAWTWRMPHLFCRTELGHLTHAELNPAPRSLPAHPLQEWYHT